MERRRQSGFSLLELLVVVALLSLLAGILLPVYANSREKARQSACFSNMKQLALAQMLYIQDWDERLPHWYYSVTKPDGTWVRFLFWVEFFRPYTKGEGVFFDPSFTWPNGAPPANIIAHYCMFTWGPAGNGSAAEPYWRWAGPPLVLAQIVRPSETFTITDGYTTTDLTLGMLIRHHDGVNGAFLDGHARWVKRDWMFKVVQNGRGEYYFRHISADRD
jgi:prepilin-type N-terminal cleavage/methylation domain-containing protein/prepilin-type processing-associated H-X9-DG protein